MRQILFALLSMLSWAILAPATLAHAVLLATTPADGAMLAMPPAAVRLTFNEAVRPLVVRHVAPDGTETDLTDSIAGATELVIPLDGIGRGTHVVSWRVVSEDGHPIPGSLLFSIGEMTGAAAVPAEGDTAVRSAIWLARAAMAIALVVAVGGAAFGAMAPVPQDARRPLIGAAAVALLAAPAYLGLHGLDALGAGFAALATPAPWIAAAGTSFGPSVAMAMAAALLAVAGLWARSAAVLALVLLGVSYAASGHAGAAWPQALTRPLVAVHLIALTLWIGALIPLALSLHTDTTGLRRFSAAIPFAVILLAGSGIALATVQLGGDVAHWRAPYARILAAKLVLLAVVLALAASNRWRLTAPVLAGDAQAVRRMRRGIALELLCAVAILGLTAGWRFTPPPRALAQAAPAAASAFAHLHSDAVMANLIATPGRAGPIAMHIEIGDGDMNPLSVIGATLLLSLPERGIEGLERSASPLDGVEGVWRIPDLVLPFPGTWTVALDIRLSRFSKTTLSGTLTLK
ncbi:copper transport protein [Gemmobacter megaterium]|uniref:Copper transport protein n=1 Tax=Gemmobacter megaterium TaxID=1086013 RepID=A0A1N7PWX0_9RHOB|nr:copper resistance protein CopC [Gemmobacter megaterium]GGE21951.1 copper resistance protein C [Gemmobacter megaterium]SIT15086.1 copper transport protein [Gemmobacter megaterium]